MLTLQSQFNAKTNSGVFQAGVKKLLNLRVLLMSNNKVKDWAEISKLGSNAKLEELLLIGNPLVPMPGSPEYRLEVQICIMLPKTSICK